MKYYEQNGVKIIECAPSEFSVKLMDKTKKNLGYSTYVNAGYFGGFKENGEYFTLPSNHLIADYEATGKMEKKYCQERGKFIGNKFYFDSYSFGRAGDQFYHKSLTTFVIKNGVPSIYDMGTLDTSATYAVVGIPVIKNGEDVKWLTYVKPQGWSGGELYGTYHIFLGLKKNSNTIYIMDWCSTSSNLIYSGEAYKKFSAMGFYNLIKLDGGGSEIMKYNGLVKHALSENRQISSAIIIKAVNNSTNDTPSKTNPYQMPTKAVYRGKTGNDVRWVQFQLNKAGYSCSVDGSFGPATESALKAYQKDHGLAVDGSCGPATRAVLAKE